MEPLKAVIQWDELEVEVPLEGATTVQDVIKAALAGFGKPKHDHTVCHLEGPDRLYFPEDLLHDLRDDAQDGVALLLRGVF